MSLAGLGGYRGAHPAQLGPYPAGVEGNSLPLHAGHVQFHHNVLAQAGHVVGPQVGYQYAGYQDGTEFVMQQKPAGSLNVPAVCVAGGAGLGIMALLLVHFAGHWPQLTTTTTTSPEPVSAPGYVRSSIGSQTDVWQTEEQRSQKTFYMYRAQSDNIYAMENVNMANLAGVMWYLHNEIVKYCPRNRHVTRILRYKVTVKNTEELAELKHTFYGPFVAFDSARCTVPGCASYWNKYGYVVGCQKVHTDLASYAPLNPAHGGRPVWYSLPGRCPSMPYGTKTEECISSAPGGACRAVSGSRDCTYGYQMAGWVDLNNLTGMAFSTPWLPYGVVSPNYTEFCQSGGLEYDPVLDTGHNVSFWDYKHDKAACDARMQAVLDAFASKYPHMPTELGAPPECDWNEAEPR